MAKGAHAFDYMVINDTWKGRRRNRKNHPPQTTANISPPRAGVFERTMIEALKSDEIVNKVGGRFKLTALIQKRMLELMDGARPLVERGT
jgi:hypothetical protein